MNMQRSTESNMGSSPFDHHSSFARSLSSVHRRQSSPMSYNNDGSDGSGGANTSNTAVHMQTPQFSSRRHPRRRSNLAYLSALSSGADGPAPLQRRSSVKLQELVQSTHTLLPFGREGSNASSRARLTSNASSSRFKQRRRYAQHTPPDARVAGRLTEEQLYERRISINALLEDLEKSQQGGSGRRQQQHEQTQDQHDGFFRPDYKLGDTLRSPTHIQEEANVSLESLSKHDFAFIKRSNGQFSFAILAYRSIEPAKHQAKNAAAGALQEDLGYEECMTFVMNGIGSTKMIRKHNWEGAIRLVAPLSSPQEQQAPPRQEEVQQEQVQEKMMYCQEIQEPNKVVLPSKYCSQDSKKNVYKVPTKWADKQDVRPTKWADKQEGCMMCPPVMISFAAPFNHHGASSPPMEGDDDDCSVISSVSDRVRYGC